MTLLDWGRRIAREALPMEERVHGPWLGANLALPDDVVSNEYVADGQNYQYVPAHGYWRRRRGQTIKFEASVAAAVGLLPAKWSGKCRWLSEFKSDSIADGVPTMAALVTNEDITSGLDDGRYSNLWLRNQVDDANYTLGSEYDATAYPIPGTALNPYKIVPLWYESGDGGLTRGTSEFNRRFFLNGSRSALDIGNYLYFPNRLGTPCRWRKQFETATGGATVASRNYNRLFPTGPISPTHPGTVGPGAVLADGPFKGSDRFGLAVCYVFEDGSRWMPTQIRLPNERLANGFGIFTIDAANPGATYQSFIVTNAPIGPHGVKAREFYRTPKVDSTGTNPWNISPYDIRFIGRIQDNTTTTFESFDGDDATLPPFDASWFKDLMMPPRARYSWAGDMRVCHAYGAEGPCAIQIAPISHTAAGDLNKADDAHDFSIYGTGAVNGYGASYMWLQNESGLNNTTLKLVQYDTEGDVMATKDFTLSSYDTLQKLVDAINATTLAADGQEWRAQLCPSANPNANPATALVPHTRQFAGEIQLTSGSANLDCSAGGLSQVAVGTRIRVSGTPAMDGFVITAIVSDTRLTMSAVSTVTNATATVDFYFDLGDNPTAGTTNFGYQRCIANSLPAFLYFTTTELNKGTVDNAAVWMTTADPGQTKSAPNAWSRAISNRHTPPARSGQCLGGGAVDNGFVVFWANKRGAIRNTKDSGTGLDSDYRLFITNENSGCTSWMTIAAGNGFVTGWAIEGLVCASLFEEKLISEAVWVRSQNWGDTGTELYPQIANDVAATGADTDGARMHVSIINGVIMVGYGSGSSQPIRILEYDFSGGMDSAGLKSLERAPGIPWGWSVRLVHTCSRIAQGRRSDGAHIYIWNEVNAGSGGDGRLDEIDTGDTDNGTAISALIYGPWQRGGDGYDISGQEIIAEHSTPAASSVSLTFVRNFVNQTSYAMTPAGEDSVAVTSTLKMLPQAARTATDGCRLLWTQSSGVAGQIRKLVLRLKRIKRYS